MRLYSTMSFADVFCAAGGFEVERFGSLLGGRCLGCVLQANQFSNRCFCVIVVRWRRPILSQAPLASPAFGFRSSLFLMRVVVSFMHSVSGRRTSRFPMNLEVVLHGGHHGFTD